MHTILAAPLAFLGWGAVLWVLHFQANAAHLVIAVGQDRPPYISAGGQHGLELAIIREALASEGHTFDSFQASNRRLNHLLASGGVDAAAGTQEKPDGAFYSAPYITYRYVVISKQKQQLQIGDINDLLSLRVVTSQNTYQQLGDSFAARFAPIRQQQPTNTSRYLELPNPVQAVKMFWQDRADVVILEENVFSALSEQLDQSFNTSEQIVVHNIFQASPAFQVSFKNENLRNDFNNGLTRLHTTGRYQALKNRYLN